MIWMKVYFRFYDAASILDYACGAQRGAVLYSGKVLNAGDYLRSVNGKYYAVLQSDNNFVIYPVRIVELSSTDD